MLAWIWARTASGEYSARRDDGKGGGAGPVEPREGGGSGSDRDEQTSS